MNATHLIYLILVFVAVSAAAYGLVWFVVRPNLTQDRLRAVVSPAGSPEAAEDTRWQKQVAELAKPIARLALPTEGWEKSNLRTLFMNAGWRQSWAPMLYFAAKASLALFLPTLFMFYAGIASVPWETRAMLAFILLLATIGYYFPNLVLRLTIRRRQLELFEAFPDGTDLIIVCIEAGLGLDAAIARAAEEMRVRSEELADELHLVGLELRVGATREQALRNLALRTGLDEAATLVTMLIQADRFGTSIAESLRVHADELRTRRRHRAEEAAAKIPVKLLFPLVFFIFPALMLVLLGPAVLSIYRVFITSYGGQ